MRLGRKRIAVVILVFAAVPPHASVAQSSMRRPQSNADTVRLTADVFLRAVADERWQVAATMLDTNIVRAIVGQRLRWQRQLPPIDLTIEEFLRDDPAKPRVVAEYELKRYRERSSPTDSEAIALEFSGIRSLRELSRLSALEATSRYLQAQDVRVQLRELARRGGCADSTARSPASIRRIVGVALTSDSLAYVLHEDATPRDESDGLPRLEPMVLQLRRRAGRWVITPGGALLHTPRTVASWLSCDSPRRPAP